MTDEARRYLRKAEHALEVAEDLLKGGHAPDAASKILGLKGIDKVTY